jgi:hypothetical protein
MPTLDWIGKKAVLNHHNDVPFHLMREEPSLSVGDPGSGALMWKSGFDFTTTVKWSNDFLRLSLYQFSKTVYSINGNQH